MKPTRMRGSSLIKKRKPTDRTILGKELAKEWRKMLNNKPELKKHINATVRTALSRLNDKDVTNTVKKAKQIGREN